MGNQYGNTGFHRARNSFKAYSPFFRKLAENKQ
jgi:hypothetical protein